MTRPVPPISPRNLTAIYRAERGPSWSVDTDPHNAGLAHSIAFGGIVLVSVIMWTALAVWALS